VRQGGGGVGEPGRHMEEAGHEQGGGSLPTCGRRPACSGLRPTGAGDVHRACAAGRTEGDGRG
jgi:hypothetical protein